MAWKAGGKEWEEVEVYGNEDVAYGIKLVMGDIKTSIKESSIIKAVFRTGDEKKEITGDEVVLKTIEGKAYAKGDKSEPVIMIFKLKDKESK